jgi:hypothetical protein
MTRSRLVVLSSIVVVALGVLAAVGAVVLNPARASVGPLPAEALVLPADSAFLVGLDVRRFTASPFYRKYAKANGAVRPESFADLEAKTGLNPERDLDLVVISGKKAGGPDASVALVSGSFDRHKIGRTLETEKKGVTWKTHQGTTLYLFGEGAKGARALAFLDDHTLVLGSQAAVEATVASHASGSKALRGNAALVELLTKVKPGSTFWMVGDQTLLANMPTSIPAPGAAPGAHGTLTFPALKHVTVTGDLDPLVAVEVTGAASDEAAAKNLADVVRGFLALATLQASQRPELKNLASAVNVTTEANEVHVSARFAYELLDALQPQKTAAEPKRPH